MKYFLRKLRFILRHDIDFEYIVFDHKAGGFVSFLDYTEALKFSKSQIEYDPKVMVGVYGGGKNNG